MLDAAIGIIQDTEGKTLWVKRRDVPIWVLPGGGIDPQETPEEAACREVLEETGLTVQIKRKAAEYSPINRWTATTHVFFCQWEQGTPTCSNESKDVAYFATPPHPCFPLHALWLKEALEHPDRIVKRPLNDFTWWKVGAFFLKHPIIFLKYLFTNACGRGRDHDRGHERAP